MSTEELLSAYRNEGLVALFVASAVDHTGIPVPLMVAVAFAAELRIELWEVMVVGLAGALVGDLAIWAFGRHLLRRAFASPRFGKRLSQASVFAAGYPSLSVLLGRFIPAVGKALPAAAAAQGMGLGRFLVLSTAGAVLHGAAYVALAWGVTEAFQQPTLWHAWPIMASVALILGVSIWVRRMSSSNEEHNEPSTRSP